MYFFTPWSTESLYFPWGLSLISLGLYFIPLENLQDKHTLAHYKHYTNPPPCWLYNQIDWKSKKLLIKRHNVPLCSKVKQWKQRQLVQWRGSIVLKKNIWHVSIKFNSSLLFDDFSTNIFDRFEVRSTIFLMQLKGNLADLLFSNVRKWISLFWLAIIL